MARRKKTISKRGGSGAVGKAVKAGASLLGSKKEGGKRRSRGPAYWANRVIVEKLKQRFRRLKYGNMR